MMKCWYSTNCDSDTIGLMAFIDTEMVIKRSLPMPFPPVSTFSVRLPPRSDSLHSSSLPRYSFDQAIVAIDLHYLS